MENSRVNYQLELEWRKDDHVLIQTVNLKRPTQEFLNQNGMPIEKIPSNDNIKKEINLSKFYIFEEKIFCGYEDGLILLWLQKVYIFLSRKRI